MAIEIVDFPSYKMVIFHGKMLVHQRVCGDRNLRESSHFSILLPVSLCFIAKNVCELENGTSMIDLHIKDGDFPVCYVSLPEGI